MLVQIIAILCVVSLALGQIFFKLTANSLVQTGSLFALRTALTLIIAMMLYAITSVAWVWLLQKVHLGRVYPLMALGFILVPLGSYFVFDEHFSGQYFIGVALIITGIIIAVKT